MAVMGRIRQEGQAETASEIATLVEGTYKVQIPKACMAILTWPRESPVELIAELVESGRIRLHLASTILHEIEARRTEIQATSSPNRLDLLGAIDDRYRTVSLYTNDKSENSVRLEEERIRLFLEILPADNRKLFVESTKDTVDIMSLTCWKRRQEKVKDSIGV
jgi:hypothetical protein